MLMMMVLFVLVMVVVLCVVLRLNIRIDALNIQLFSFLTSKQSSPSRVLHTINI